MFYFVDDNDNVSKIFSSLGRIVLNCRQVGRYGEGARNAQNAADGGEWDDIANHISPIWLHPVWHAAGLCLASWHDDDGGGANVD